MEVVLNFADNFYYFTKLYHCYKIGIKLFNLVSQELIPQLNLI